MTTKDKLNKIFIPAALCHIITFILTMWLVPALCSGWPDIRWISLRIIAAVAVMVFFTLHFTDISAVVYFFMSVVQDMLGFALRVPLSRIYGIPSTPLGEFEYIGQIFVWITGIVILQMIIISVTKFILENIKQNM